MAVSAAMPQPVEITISGEVTHPGTFPALPGSRIGDLIKKSRPKRFADLSGIDHDSQVEKTLELKIPKMFEISIRVVGAVEAPQELKVLPGSRICDLKSKIHCAPNADLRFFKQRRLLKNGEMIFIPRKEVAIQPVVEQEKTPISTGEQEHS